MSQTLDYSTADVRQRPRVRRLNLVAVPVLVALVLAFALQGEDIAMRWRFPRLIGNALFFLPQTCFPYTRLIWNDGSGRGRVLDVATARVFGNVQWIVVAAALTYFLRRPRLRYVIPIVVLVTLVIAIWGPMMFEPFGMYLQVDAP